ncbi:ABC transporter ATP-binding protein [Spirochaetia bacterium]|nr:ABC transporter ATP-binding protein [Spirochaetia bacterium]
MIAIENLNFGFTEKRIFNGFSLTLGKNIADENPVVFLGPSGCGKTTLLRLISGLIRQESGKITITDTKNNRFSFVFQEPRLINSLNVLKNVMLPIEKLMGKAESEQRARHFLSLSSMESYLAAMPYELSGGQKQRVSIARAWAYPAPLILMDEPFQSLDIPLRIQLMDAVQTLMSAESRFLIAVTHDPREALYLGKRIIVLGSEGSGVVLDEMLPVGTKHRRFVPEDLAGMEMRLIGALGGTLRR